MSGFDARILAKMDLVLEEVCRELSKCGGDHESRKYVARRLMTAARAGKTTLDELRSAGHDALRHLTTRRSA